MELPTELGKCRLLPFIVLVQLNGINVALDQEHFGNLPGFRIRHFTNISKQVPVKLSSLRPRLGASRIFRAGTPANCRSFNRRVVISSHWANPQSYESMIRNITLDAKLALKLH